MAGNWVARCLLSGLHMCAGLSAGGSLVAVLLQWAQNLNCLPPITDSFGDPVSVTNALGHTCDVITYGSGAISALNFLMAVSLNCCWGTWCCYFLHQMLTILMCLFSAGSGAALTVDFFLWCHTLENNVAVYSGCGNAAGMYDNIHKTSNMTAYFRKMELQQTFQWAVVPFTFCAAIVYAVVMKTETLQGPLPGLRGGRYYLLTDDETAPLIIGRETVITTAEGNRRQANSASGMTASDGVNAVSPTAPN